MKKKPKRKRILISKVKDKCWKCITRDYLIAIGVKVNNPKNRHCVVIADTVKYILTRDKTAFTQSNLKHTEFVQAVLRHMLDWYEKEKTK